MNIGIHDGLIDPKHERAMGNAVWLFLWLIRAQTQRRGGHFVYGGALLTYDEIAHRSGFPVRKVRFWLDRLRKHSYVRVSYGVYKMMRIEIAKPKKWFPKQSSMQLFGHRQDSVNHDCQDTVNHVTENCQSNKRYSMRENYKTPLPPASGGQSSENFFDYHGTVIAIQMGNRKRLPVNTEGRMQAESYAEWLTRKGFPARVVQHEEFDGTVN